MVDSSGGVAADELRAFIERVERLEEEKAGIAGDIKEVFAEAKGCGFDTKAIRTIVRMRRQDQAERQEQAAILELYMQALGMLADTPLGRAAASREFGDTKITISTPGKAPIETTSAGLQHAAGRVGLDSMMRGRRSTRPKSFKDEVGDALDGAFGAERVLRDARQTDIQDLVRPPAVPTIEESERMLADATPATLKGTTVLIAQFEPGERRDALRALALSKGASVILDGGEVVEPEKPKRARKTFDERIAERAAAVTVEPPARAGRKKQIGAMEPA